MRDFFNVVEYRPLRPHQVHAIELVRAAFARGVRRVVLQAPTGMGKTRTAAEIIAMAQAKGRKVLFTVPRLALVDQAVKDFLRDGVPHVGVIQGNHPRTDASAPVQVASVQTLARRDITDDFGLVIVDECHETFRVIYDLMDKWPDKHFVGLSATPWAKGMGKHWQDLCIAATIGDLIGKGFLSQFVVYAPDVPDLSGVKTIAGDYAEDALAKVMGDGKLMASVVETWLSRGEDRPTFCFGVNRAHARFLQAEFQRQGVSAGYCDAHTDQAEMAWLEKQFVSGEIRVMCSVRKMTTGIDWPVSCIIDAAPTQSEMLHVQKIGRGLRVNPGTEDLVVLDHAGNSLRLGLVTDIFHDRLSTGDKAEAKKRTKAEKIPAECPKCAVLFTGKNCPACGHERKVVAEVQTTEGQLVQISGKVKVASKAEKQAWWSGLLFIAKYFRRQKGWASHTYKERFGVWPKGLDDVPAPAAPEMWSFVKAKDIRHAKSKGRVA